MSKGQLIEEGLTREVVGCFYDVYDEFGFGFLENVYSKALVREMGWKDLRPVREFEATVNYKGDPLCSYRLDLVVNEKLIVEIKSTEILPAGSMRQLCNYLRATQFEVGLLLHFGLEPKFYRRILTNDMKKSRNKILSSPDGYP